MAWTPKATFNCKDMDILKDHIYMDGFTHIFSASYHRFVGNDIDHIFTNISDMKPIKYEAVRTITDNPEIKMWHEGIYCEMY